ncbi:hypothetical protein BD413DRAFT_496535, partial [Trametes elegans]
MKCQWRGCNLEIAKDNLLAHMRAAHARQFAVGACWWKGCPERHRSTEQILIRHVESTHLRFEVPTCHICGRTYSRKDAVTRHRKVCTPV